VRKEGRGGGGEGKRRAAVKLAEERKSNDKNETEGGGGGFLPTHLALGGRAEGESTATAARSPRQPAALGPSLHGYARLHNFLKLKNFNTNKCYPVEGAAAAGEQLLPRCKCFPGAAASPVAKPHPALNPGAASAPLPRLPLPLLCHCPVAGLHLPQLNPSPQPTSPRQLLPRSSCSPAEEGDGEGKGRAAVEVAEERKSDDKNKTEGGREGACYLLTWLEGGRGADGHGSPRFAEPAAAGGLRSCTVMPDCTVSQNLRIETKIKRKG
jgi:hypothetical protein